MTIQTHDMTLNDDTLHKLLSMEEGPTLDFKREQYRFYKGSDEDKAELLKDILAFTNTQRFRTAHILIGVEELTGGPAKVLGVDRHLDDANLHQFVNHKTSRPVEFSYFPYSIEGKSIGVIELPIQRRPVWAEKTYGVVKANVVYVRDGSSTRPALPDEIAAMGRRNPPGLQVQWGDTARRTVYPPDYVHRSTGLTLPNEFQTWEGKHGHYDFEALARKLGGDPTIYDGPRINRLRERTMYKSLGLRFFNNSGSVGENVRFVGILKDGRGVRFKLPGHSSLSKKRLLPPDKKIQLYPSGDGIEIAVEVGHIRPREYVWAGRGTQFLTKESDRLIWKGRFVADNLPEPIECLLPLQVEYEEREIQAQDLESGFDLRSTEWLP